MKEHETFTREAILLAANARKKGNAPFGALLARQGEIILRAENTVVSGKNPTQHAEMNLIQLAWSSLDANVIRDATLYTSTEPCPMCTGAIFWSEIRCVVFSVSAKAQAEMAHDRFTVSCVPLLQRANYEIKVIGPVLEQEGLIVHKGFWQSE